MHARYQSMPGMVTSATVSRPDPFLAVLAKNSYIGAGGPTAAAAAVGKTQTLIPKRYGSIQGDFSSLNSR